MAVQPISHQSNASGARPKEPIRVHSTKEGSPEGHYLLGRLAEAQGRLADAEREYREAMKAAPDDSGRYRVALDSDDKHTHLLVEGQVAPTLPASSVFCSLAEASAFFEHGSLGYSVTARPDILDGLELRSLRWQVQPLAIETAESSFFMDRTVFPVGSVELDCALLMRGIDHEWHGRGTLEAGPLPRRREARQKIPGGLAGDLCSGRAPRAGII